MARGKAINVKVATTKVIKALEASLEKITKQYEAEEKAQQAYEKEKEAYNKAIAEACMKNFSKATDVRVGSRWNNLINVDFNIPASVIKLKEPEQPSRSYWQHQYDEDKAELQNAIRILKLTDEEVVSTSTYNAVARFI